MADAPAKKKIAFDHWTNQPSQSKPDLTAQRLRLFEALSSFVAAQGGFVTSPPNSKHLRVEVPQNNSALPSRLLELGYVVRSAGVGTRLSPGTTPEEIFQSVEIIEVTLGK